MTPRIYLLPLSFLILSPGLATQTCYFPDGVTTDQDGYPCNTTAGATASVCCRTFEACLTGGVCYTQFDSVIYRRSCTDPTFSNPACPRPCLSVERDGPAGLLQCTTGTNPSYCCGLPEGSCCSNASAVFNFTPGGFEGVLDGSGNLGTVGSASSGASSTVTTDTRLVSTATVTGQNTPNMTAASSTSSATTSSSNSPSHQSHTGRTVGLAAGIPLGILFLFAVAGVLFFMNRLRRERNQRVEAEERLAAAAPGVTSRRAEGHHESDQDKPGEASGIGAQELDTSRRRHELESAV